MMGMLSPILRNVEGGRLAWRCPGCNESHQIATGEGPGPRWGWNGSAERPTFTPSVLVTGRAFTDAGDAAFDAWHAAGCPQPAPNFEGHDIVCHSFVVDGQMQFLSDCTHALAGQTVPIPPWPGSTA